jgi:hypothetical protein
MTMSDWAALRKKWVTARNAAKPKVGAGAVKGVSMGDAIDGVHKAQKDYSTLEAATKKLLADVDTYKTGISKKNGNLAKWIEQNVEASAKKLLTDLVADVKLLRAALAFYGKFNTRKEAYFPGDLVKKSIEVDDQKKPLKVLFPDDYKWLVDTTAFYASIAKMLDKTANDLKVDLQNNEVRKKLKANADLILHEVAVIQKLIIASDKPGFAQMLSRDAQSTDLLWNHARDGYVLVQAVIGK